LFADRDENFRATSKVVVDKLWELLESKPVLDKFEAAMLLLGKAAINRGEHPGQDVAALVRLRNGIAHFKPEWDGEQTSHESLSKLLKGRFAESPYFPNDGMFPRRWITHAATSWAVTSATSFVLVFEKQAGLKGKLDSCVNQLSP
jgi:hypothetical protein